MTDERELNPELLQEIGNVRKQICEKNMMEKFKEAFENKLKQSEEYKNYTEILQNQFGVEQQSYEDAFRALGGKAFSEENADKELDDILKNLAKLHAEKLKKEDTDELFKEFFRIYRSMSTS